MQLSESFSAFKPCTWMYMHSPMFLLAKFHCPFSFNFSSSLHLKLSILLHPPPTSAPPSPHPNFLSPQSLPLSHRLQHPHSTLLYVIFINSPSFLAAWAHLFWFTITNHFKYKEPVPSIVKGNSAGINRLLRWLAVKGQTWRDSGKAEDICKGRSIRVGKNQMHTYNRTTWRPIVLIRSKMQK